MASISRAYFLFTTKEAAGAMLRLDAQIGFQHWVLRLAAAFAAAATLDSCDATIQLSLSLRVNLKASRQGQLV